MAVPPEGHRDPGRAPQTLGRAAGRKEATRIRLAELALELFAERGFDQTSAGEIAAAAGVTERTFFNHFPTKLDAIFPSAEYGTFETLRGLLAAAPAEVDDLTALTTCGLRWMSDDVAADPHWHHRAGRLRMRVSATSVSVLGRRAAAHQGLTEAMIAGLAERQGRARATTEQEALAVAVSAVLHHAFVRWLENDDPLAFPGIAKSLLDVFSISGSVRTARAPRRPTR